MTDEPKHTGTERGLTIAIFVTLALTLAGVAFYFWLIFSRWAKLGEFGAAADALGPFIGLATVGALLAALWSVKLQREELRLQREEMAQSRAELAKAAAAQESLAKAQRNATKALRDSAEAQHVANQRQDRANHWARRAELAQRSANLATLRDTLVRIRIERARATHEGRKSAVEFAHITYLEQQVRQHLDGEGEALLDAAKQQY